MKCTLHTVMAFAIGLVPSLVNAEPCGERASMVTEFGKHRPWLRPLGSARTTILDEMLTFVTCESCYGVWLGSTSPGAWSFETEWVGRSRVCRTVTYPQAPRSGPIDCQPTA